MACVLQPGRLSVSAVNNESALASPSVELEQGVAHSLTFSLIPTAQVAMCTQLLL